MTTSTTSVFSPSPASAVLTDGTIVRGSLGPGTAIQFLNGATGVETACVDLTTLVPSVYAGSTGFSFALLELGNGDVLVLVRDPEEVLPTLAVTLDANGDVVNGATPVSDASATGNNNTGGFFETNDGGYIGLALDDMGVMQAVEVDQTGAFLPPTPVLNAPDRLGLGIELADGTYIAFDSGLSQLPQSTQPPTVTLFDSDFTQISSSAMPQVPLGYSLGSRVMDNGFDHYAIGFFSETGNPIIAIGSRSGPTAAAGPDEFVTLPPTSEFVPDLSVLWEIEVLPDGSFVVLWFNQTDTPESDGVRWFWAQIDADGNFVSPVVNVPVVNEQTSTPLGSSATFTLLSIVPLTDPDGSFLLSRDVTTIEAGLGVPGGLSITQTVTDSVVDVDLGAVVRELQTTSDTFFGSDLDELIRAFAGDDFVQSLGGDDEIIGDAGRDFLDGGTGNDTLMGGDDADILVGGAGNDMIDGGDGQDLLSAFGATSGVTIDLGNLALSSADFAGDTLVSIEGILGATTVSNTLTGTAEDDLFIGGNEADVLIGNDGADILLGQGGNDIIDSGAGRDVVLSGFGDDTITTGADPDVILFALNEANGEGNDVITDFELGFDTIIFYGTGFATEDVSVGTAAGSTNALLSYASSSVEIEGVTAAEALDPGNFVFFEV